MKTQLMKRAAALCLAVVLTLSVNAAALFGGVEKAQSGAGAPTAQAVEIRTYRAIDRQKEFTGILKAYDENTVTIAYEDDTEQTFERADIALIRLALDF